MQATLNGKRFDTAKKAARTSATTIWKILATAGREVLRFAAWCMFVFAFVATWGVIRDEAKGFGAIDPSVIDHNMTWAAICWYGWWKFK